MYHFLKENLRRKVVIFTYEDEDGYEHVHEFAATITVCDTCEGKGTTTTHIDGHGITAEEWDNEWSPDEQDDYLNGKYDRPCSECNGNRVMLEIDRDAADPKMLVELDSWIRCSHETAAEHAAEMRMGA